VRGAPPDEGELEEDAEKADQEEPELRGNSHDEAEF